MKRYHQTVEEILDALSAIDTTWRDEYADRVINIIGRIPSRETYSRADLVEIFCAGSQAKDVSKDHFRACLTIMQLFLDISKDEFTAAYTGLAEESPGVSRFRQNPDACYTTLEKLGALERMTKTINQPVTWIDILEERLKGGRGSAIKGQARGRQLEDFVEEVVKGIFGPEGYDLRCRFTGVRGAASTEKCDFAIPSREEPRILIEVKAYGATGSKQTDVLGDIARIVEQKRNDTDLLLVTDGDTWKARTNDLRKLVKMQNDGLIARIYTSKMRASLKKDLIQLRADHSL